jgi:hypothetical protein
MVGVLVFLLLLLLAVQVLFNLYATSAVTAAAYDGARIAAGYDAAHDPTGRANAEDHVRSVLGRYGRERLSLQWADDPDVEILTVHAKNPSFLPIALRAPLGLDEIDRTVRVRIEREVAP